jgi:chromosome segregation ATPase
MTSPAPRSNIVHDVESFPVGDPRLEHLERRLRETSQELRALKERKRAQHPLIQCLEEIASERERTIAVAKRNERQYRRKITLLVSAVRTLSIDLAGLECRLEELQAEQTPSEELEASDPWPEELDG